MHVISFCKGPKMSFLSQAVTMFPVCYTSQTPRQHPSFSPHLCFIRNLILPTRERPKSLLSCWGVMFLSSYEAIRAALQMHKNDNIKTQSIWHWLTRNMFITCDIIWHTAHIKVIRKILPETFRYIPYYMLFATPRKVALSSLKRCQKEHFNEDIQSGCYVVFNVLFYCCVSKPTSSRHLRSF